MRKRTKLLDLSVAVAAMVMMLIAAAANASTLVPQTALPGDCIPQFTQPLPVFGPGYNAVLPRVDASTHPSLTVTMKEIDQWVLPNTTISCPLLPGSPSIQLGKTRVWAYETSDTFRKTVLGPANWPAVTVEAKRHMPTVMTYSNQLPSFNTLNPTGPGLVQGLVSVDQTIDWADPLGTAAANGCTMFPQTLPLNPACMTPYVGTPPAVPHLHGGEVSSRFDGGPLAWFTPGGITGRDFQTLYNAGLGKAVYFYQNSQEPGTLWFHDHTMGMTRTNVYSGMAAFYFLRDKWREPLNLPSGAYEIEIALQDRQFGTDSQLYWPDGSGADAATSNLNGTPPNPNNHPFWIPEFIGDVAIANGAPWPYLNVEPRRYRLRLLGGANARMWSLNFGAVPVYVIGSDDNYLDAPVTVAANSVNPGRVFFAPGERVDVIVDFTNFAGQTITVANDAPVPYPMGLVPGVDQPGMANVMQFNVTVPLAGADTSCNPATACKRPVKMVHLTDGNGNVAAGVKIDKKRQLILKEYQGLGGPLTVFVQNTQFMGTMSPSIAALFPTDGVSELPRVGSIEEWEIINLTVDAHPMHTHLAQFQVLNRQPYDTDGTLGSGIPGGYLGLWASSFPADLAYSPLCTGGVFCPGWGPPLPYTTPNADGAVGGNPAISPFLLGAPTPPDPWESGWKDTAKAYPGTVTRLLVRFSPTSTPVIPNRSFAGLNFYPFDPTKGPGYVWHCHIVDHEDQDMMRPYKLIK